MDTPSKQPDLKGGSNDLERLFARTFSSLRLFVDRNDPLSTNRAIEHANRELDNYKRWRESGAPISGVAVRLADGEEMTIIKRSSRMLAATCFVMDLLPGAVLNIYKKADKYFGEVLLYTVEVAEIPPEGFTFRKNYPNKQSLILDAQHGKEGQLNISVDYTLAPEAARSNWLNRIPVLGATLLALAGVLYLIRRRMPRVDMRFGQPSWASIIAVATSAGLLLAAMSLYWNNSDLDSAAKLQPDRVMPAGQTPSGSEGASQAAVNEAVSQANVVSAEIVKSDLGSRPRIGKTDDHVNQSNTSNSSTDTSTSNGNEGETCAVSYTEGAANVAANANSRQPQRKPVIRETVRTGNSKPNALASAPSEVQLIPIYVKVFVKDDQNLKAALLRNFVKALEKTDRFKVWTDEPGRQIPKDVYEVSLDFTLDKSCYGMIYARLYNLNNQQIWDDIKDCHEYPRESMLKITSKEMVANILPILTSTRADSGS
ncbi:MAG TPA: hypothetical protein VM911_08200 [Pyrinomonadaceae bacterium]|nr:hypothetical protein [Pyrinomonadaceae bacterium]